MKEKLKIAGIVSAPFIIALIFFLVAAIVSGQVIKGICGVDVDSRGDIYIAELGCIKVYNENGEYLRKVKVPYINGYEFFIRSDRIYVSRQEISVMDLYGNELDESVPYGIKQDMIYNGSSKRCFTKDGTEYYLGNSIFFGVPHIYRVKDGVEEVFY